MELTAGSKLGNFTVIRQIGVGGMSEVYLVQDNLDRLFALKTMSTRLSHDPSFRQRFAQEARIMASLTHPNIVQLHSYFEEDGNFCLVMEYVDGCSLKELSRRIGPIPEKRALKILRQMAEALSYAHRRGIIHRDVKPSNILLDADDNVKVMDFGIARMTENPGLTQTGSQMGTLFYMSPEQVRDSKNVDEKTDVYSLGVSFYEMLTGRLPFDERSTGDFEIREQIVYKELPDPRNIYPHIGEESLRLLAGLTRKKAEERLPLAQFLAGVIPERQEAREQPAAGIEISEKRENTGLSRSQNTLLIVLIAGLIILFTVGALIIWNRRNSKKVNPERIEDSDVETPETEPQSAPVLEGEMAEEEPLIWSAFTFVDLVESWNDAHNDKNYGLLSSLFADELKFYTRIMSRSDVVKSKQNLLDIKNTYFYQEIAEIIDIKETSSNSVRVDFFKDVYLEDGSTRYHAYLIFEHRDGRWQIVHESDTTTDSNQRKREEQKKK